MASDYELLRDFLALHAGKNQTELAPILEIGQPHVSTLMRKYRKSGDDPDSFRLSDDVRGVVKRAVSDDPISQAFRQGFDQAVARLQAALDGIATAPAEEMTDAEKVAKLQKVERESRPLRKGAPGREGKRKKEGGQ